METIDAVIFDLDGTLWNAIDNCVNSLAKVKTLHKEITKEITKEDVQKSMGLTFNEIVDRYYGYIDKNVAINYLIEASNINIKDLQENGAKLYPKLEKTIEYLSKKYKLCIVSNCVEGYIEAFLKTSDLEKYFCDFECNGKTKLNKGENIRLIMKRNNIKKAIYVGDTISDKKAADYAKIPFAYASYGFGNVEEFDYKLEEISDLISIL